MKILFSLIFSTLFLSVYSQSIEDKISQIKKGKTTKKDINDLFGKPAKKEFTENGEVWNYSSFSVEKETLELSGGSLFQRSNPDIVGEKKENIFTVSFNEEGLVSSFKYSNSTSDEITEDDRKNFTELIDKVISQKIQGELKYKGAKVTIGKYENSASDLEKVSTIFLMNQIAWKNYIALFTKDPLLNETKMFNLAIDLVKKQDPTANSTYIYRELNKNKKVCRNGKCFVLEKIANKSMLLIVPSSEGDLKEIL